MKSNWVGQNSEPDEEHNEDCVEDGLQLARVKFKIDGNGDKDALGILYYSINI